MKKQQIKEHIGDAYESTKDIGQELSSEIAKSEEEVTAKEEAYTKKPKKSLKQII